MSWVLRFEAWDIFCLRECIVGWMFGAGCVLAASAVGKPLPGVVNLGCDHEIAVAA